MLSPLLEATLCPVNPSYKFGWAHKMCGICPVMCTFARDGTDPEKSTFLPSLLLLEISFLKNSTESLGLLNPDICLQFLPSCSSFIRKRKPSRSTNLHSRDSCFTQSFQPPPLAVGWNYILCLKFARHRQWVSKRNSYVVTVQESHVVPGTANPGYIFWPRPQLHIKRNCCQNPVGPTQERLQNSSFFIRQEIQHLLLSLRMSVIF